MNLARRWYTSIQFVANAKENSLLKEINIERSHVEKVEL